MNRAPRYAPGQAFPSYAYLPGRDPHPTQDPKGHSWRGDPATRPHGDDAPAYLPPERWAENRSYLYGCDLYNHGYLWEAHEAWEEIWHPSKRDPQVAEFLQGLIQCAAAALKIPMAQPAGVARLAQLGTGRLEQLTRSGKPHFMGLDVLNFVRDYRAWIATSPSDPAGRPQIFLG